MRDHLLMRLNLSRNFHKFFHSNNDHTLGKSLKGFGIFRLTVRSKLHVHVPLIARKMLQKQQKLIGNRLGIGEYFSSSFEGVSLQIKSDLSATLEIFIAGMFFLSDNHQRISVTHL